MLERWVLKLPFSSCESTESLDQRLLLGAAMVSKDGDGDRRKGCPWLALLQKTSLCEVWKDCIIWWGNRREVGGCCWRVSKVFPCFPIRECFNKEDGDKVALLFCLPGQGERPPEGRCRKRQGAYGPCSCEGKGQVQRQRGRVWMGLAVACWIILGFKKCQDILLCILCAMFM